MQNFQTRLNNQFFHYLDNSFKAAIFAAFFIASDFIIEKNTKWYYLITILFLIYFKTYSYNPSIFTVIYPVKPIKSRTMKPFKFHLLTAVLVILCTSTTIYAQNPGGVSTSLTLWLKGNYTTGSGPANKLKFGTSPKVEEWRNEKSSYALSQLTTTKQPEWYNGSAGSVVAGSSDSLNYNPNIKFNYSATVANASLLANSNTSTDLLGTAGTVIMVLTDDNAFRTAFTYYSNNVYRYQIKQTFRSQTSDGVAILSPINTTPSYRVDFSASAYNSPISNARIVVSRGFGSALNVRRNSTSIGTTTSETGYCPGIIAGINLGGNPGVSSNEPYNGRFGEVITYNATLSDANTRLIESYLAIKYGVTLNPNGLDPTNGYVNSSGTSIYSQGSTGTTYWNNIIGIGRDDNSGLIQKQSHTYDDSVRLYITSLVANNPANSGTITDNNDFLMMGATTGKLMEDAATASEKPSGITVRLDREWKLINTGFNQSFSMQIKLNGSASGLFTGGGTLRLLADDDGNFTNATKINSGTSGVTLSYSSGIITVTIVPASSGGIFPVNGTPKYIAVASTNGTLDDASVQFTCNKNNNLVLLEWSSTSEVSTDHYEVEKSFDLRSWSSISNISAKNTGNAAYKVSDAASNTTVYYRIKIISKTGEASYTSAQKINSNEITVHLQVYPNPVTSQLKVSWNGFKKPEQIKIFSVEGKAYNTVNIISEYNAVIQTGVLPKGVYILSVTGNGETLYTKFFKN